MLSDSAIIVRGFLPVAWEVVALDADYEPNKKERKNLTEEVLFSVC